MKTEAENSFFTIVLVKFINHRNCVTFSNGIPGIVRRILSKGSFLFHSIFSLEGKCDRVSSYAAAIVKAYKIPD